MTDRRERAWQKIVVGPTTPANAGVPNYACMTDHLPRRIWLAAAAALALVTLTANAVEASGPKWTQQSTPNPSAAVLSTLNGISCLAASACEAVGTYHDASFNYFTLAETWNGTKWAIQPSSSTPN